MSLSKAVQRGADAPTAALIAIAEQFGRWLALRQGAKIKDRRGYSMSKLLLGAVLMAFVVVLFARALGWIYG